MAITFGATAPSQVTLNFEALIATTLANYNKTLVDNIGKDNAFLDFVMRDGNYVSTEGGLYFAEPLMYAIGTANWYDGYDTLGTDPMDGVTQSQWEWRQLAVPITYSMKEIKQNKQRLVDLAKTKIQQAEMGIKESLATAILQGAGSGSITTAVTDAVTGASGVEPLSKLIAYDPTAAVSVGNIAQNTYSWWQNQYDDSAATTYGGLMGEFDHMYNNCSKGTGGSPNLIICDQTTYELIVRAHWEKFRVVNTDSRFNWEHFKFKNAVVTWDEKIPNVYAGTTDTTTATGGTAFFINSKYFKLRYESSTNFVMGPFQKPVDQDARVAHILWMGMLTLSNRRKHGVIGKIARTLS